VLRIHIKPIELTQNWTETDKNFQCAQPTNVYSSVPNRRAGQNRCARGNFFSKALPKCYQTTPNVNNKKFPNHIQSIPKALPKHYQITPKQGRIARKEVCLIHTGPIPINVQDGINVQGGFFSEN
jgi:hypothetical protein